MFGLQYYGECWAGSGSCGTYDTFGKSQLCYGKNYTKCDNDEATECVGGPHANYVYLLTEWTTWNCIVSPRITDCYFKCEFMIFN